MKQSISPFENWVDTRSAWVLEKSGGPAAGGGMTDLPQQGADLMPRTAVCVEIFQDTGAEYRVDTPGAASPWRFTVKSAKEMAKETFPGYAAPRFIYKTAQSENLLPYVLGSHRAPLALPAIRADKGTWTVLDEAEIRKLGFTQTARRFAAINKKLKAVGKGKTLQERVDERGKLAKQVFGFEGFLTLAGAGGKNICAACVPLSEAKDLVVDQTLYWKVIEDKGEAWFQVGMLNSRALTVATLPFNPKGDFSERHIHTLPYRLMPVYDPGNDDHVRIAELAEEIAGLATAQAQADPYLCDPTKALTARRRKMRDFLAKSPLVSELEGLAEAALGVTVDGEVDLDPDSTGDPAC